MKSVFVVSSLDGASRLDGNDVGGLCLWKMSSSCSSRVGVVCITMMSAARSKCTGS